MVFAVTSPTLVGRDDEVAQLERCLDVVPDGSAVVVLIAGEAGAGKTRLVGELTVRAERRGRRVCVGRCVQLGEAIWPLAPLRDIVGALVDELDSEALDLVVGGARGVLAELVPELGENPASDSPVASERLCELVVGMFKRLAQRQPLVVVFEDLHWADATTRTLFSALARVRRLGPLWLAGTFRSDELHRRHPVLPVLAELDRTGQCERIEVRPLGRQATAELIAGLDQTAPSDPGYLDDVQRRTGGNPFFIEELIAGRTAGVPHLSDTLREVIRARAVALDEVSLDVLGVVATAGATTPDVLADVCALDEGTLRTTLERLLAGALLVPDGDEVRFRHELGREVFYDDLLPGQQARIHAALARSITQRRPERLGEIAHHWSAAHDATRALPALVAAGRQALRVGAAAEAEGHLSQALERWDSVDDAAALAGIDHPALLIETATTAFHARQLDRAIELNLQAIAELDDGDPRVIDVWLELGHLYRYTSRWDDGGAATSRALALIPASPPSRARAAALTDAVLGHLLHGRNAEALADAREAVTVAEGVGDLDVVINAHSSLVVAVCASGDHEAALRRGLGQPRALRSRRLGATHHHRLPRRTAELADLCRYAEIPALAQPGVELARASGLGGPRGVWLALSWIEALVLLGRWDEAERLVGDVAELVDHPAYDNDLAGSLGRGPDPSGTPGRGPPADRPGPRIPDGDSRTSGPRAGPGLWQPSSCSTPPKAATTTSSSSSTTCSTATRPASTSTTTSLPPQSPSRRTAPGPIGRIQGRQPGPSPGQCDTLGHVDGRSRPGRLTTGTEATALPRPSPR